MATSHTQREAVKPQVRTVAQLLLQLSAGDLRLEQGRTGSPDWTLARRRLLVDSVLRGWPIGTVYTLTEAGRSRVIDGGRRLAALRDFVQGQFALDGFVGPADRMLRENDGRLFGQLPVGLQQALHDYQVPVVELRDLPPESVRPALFRLADNDRLTSEQRLLKESGLLGEQVHELVADAALQWGMDGPRLGFSNTALVYDDVVTRALVAAEQSHLAAVEEGFDSRVRAGYPVASGVQEEVMAALRDLLTMPAMDNEGVRFSQATLLSWLLVIIHVRRRFGESAVHYLGAVMEWFEPQRRRLKAGLDLTSPQVRPAFRQLPYPKLLSAFNEAAALDARHLESIMIRDIILWLLLVAHGGSPARETTPTPDLLELAHQTSEGADMRSVLNRFVVKTGWGRWV
ncbi:hypothetical protein GCM10010149_33410 [Nonomuraea roseoviolacea subsp. roseoviolacea]|uniref:hypothetical protein n=1 Tax=Nonomuraea roseoviolacea TaxID=103837 RepID=UPI0031CFD8AA